MSSFLLQTILNGILAGCIYSLFAMGLTLIYGVLNFVNFAHGELIMWGAYFLYFLMEKPLNLPLSFALLPALFLTVLLGLGSDRLIFKPLRKANRLTLLITSLGLSFLLRNGAQLFWGAEIRTYGLEIKKGMRVLGVSITSNQVAIIVVSVLCIFLLYLFFYKSRMGKSMRAISDDLELARVMGIPSDRTIQWTWVIASSLAGLGGILLALDTNLHPGMGLINLVKAFAATLLGGVGNLWGALFGGMVIGLAENISIWILSPGYKDAIAFGIMVVMLLFRSSAVFSSKE
jgi:branched-subunit amino acid ABC-type transport system permease component